MGVFRKKKNGSHVGNYIYKFAYLGKSYSGSTGTKIEKEAEAFEKKIKGTLKGTVNEKMQDRSAILFRDAVTTHIKGESIEINKAWEAYRKEAPAMLSKQPSKEHWISKRGFWNDFAAFCSDKELLTMRDVTKHDAAEYIAHLKESGKYDKHIKTSTGKEYISDLKQLSSRTVGNYLTQIRSVFEILTDSAGLLENPFNKIPKPKVKKQTRDVFSLAELKKIAAFIEKGTALPDSTTPALDQVILEAVFIIGLNTGLRRGDICRLKWSDIDMDRGAISMMTGKTKTPVFIPISAALMDFLQKRRGASDGEYVTRELYDLYEQGGGGISYRFKQLLDELKINHTRKVDGQTRLMSSKDIHSLRHTFCYLHGMQGTPISDVQGMVGHMSPEMTAHYTNHMTEDRKRKAISQMQRISLLASDDQESKANTAKAKARRLLDSCTDPDKLQAIVDLLEK